MNTANEAFLNNRWKRVMIVVSAFFLMYLCTYIIDPFAHYFETFFSRKWTEILTDCSTTLIYCIGISEFSILISNKLNKRLPWTENPGKRLAVEAALILAVILLLHLFMALLFLLIDGPQETVMSPAAVMEETRGILQYFVVSFMIAFVIVTINTGNYMVLNWKNEALKVAELRQIAMEAELQSLKLQLDPHFVFNNLSVLSELILEDQQLGYLYAENFAKIYRYLLVNAKKDLLCLEDELKFLDAYIFLLQQRFGEGVHFDIDINKNQHRLNLPPLTLQMLVENALKHNKIPKSEPLQIRIFSGEGNQLVIENSINLIEHKEPSSGIGLRNIMRRYGLLQTAMPEVYQDEKIFRVMVPLLN